MQHTIYGANRVAKDFLYMFDDLEIAAVIDDDCEEPTFLSYPVRKSASLAESVEGQIILCDFDKRKKEARLQALGLSYGTDYLYEEDFFAKLDPFAIPAERKIAIWGTGQVAGRFCESHPEYEPAFFVDSYPKGKEWRGRPVFMPKDVADWGGLFVIVCVTKDAEIMKKLRGMGLREYRDFAGFQRVAGLPSSLLKKTIFDRAHYDLACHTMLNHLEILHGGETRCCCTTFVEQNLSNMMEGGVDEVWRSNLHKALCLSTENRTYSFCDKSMCPLFVAKKRGEAHCTQEPYKKMADCPETIALGYDGSCNLSCTTCRRAHYVAQGEEREALSAIAKKVREEYLPDCRFLILAGDGEVFLSPAYKEVYQDKNCNPAYIRLLSNGMLFNQKNWEQFLAGKTGKIMLTVSVDAATKETYESIRRGGNFDVLQENMAFAARLRKEGALSYFRMNFVVQRENFREMPLFVEWGEALGVDEIFFTKILNWGTYAPEEFEKISMMEADGVTPKPELKEVMELPQMQSSIVDLGTIQYGHKADEVDIVENYYMWELEKRGGKLFS